MKMPERSLVMINTRDIIIDPDIQRDVERRKAQFNRIMKNFNPYKVHPVLVAKIDGKYYCYDGQMTMKILKAKNKGQDLAVECLVVNGITKVEAGELFANQDENRVQVKLNDKIRVLANVGDAEKMAFIRSTEKMGFRIDYDNKINNNLIVIQAVKALYDEYQAFNDAKQYESFLWVLYEGFKNDPMQTNGKIIKGLGLFMRVYEGRYQHEDLIKSLQKVRACDIIRDAEVDRSSGNRKYAIKILDAYNQKRRVNRLDNNL